MADKPSSPIPFSLSARAGADPSGPAQVSGLWAALARVCADASLPAVVAGLVAVVVSYAGPAALMFQAAQAMDLDQARVSSWIWAVSVGSGVTGILLSLRLGLPVVTAWSTPGAALLVAGWAAYPYPEALGAFVAAGLAMALFGATGLFQAFMDRLPRAVVAAMLAGILFRFCADAFASLKDAPLLAGPMLAAYLAGRRFAPRYAVVLALAVGTVLAWQGGHLDLSGALSQGPGAGLALPVWTTPEFTGRALLGLGVPLFFVTMAGQNATGLGVLRSAGYRAPGGLLVGVTGLASTLLAPFGAHGINLAAITAAICTGPEAHPDPARRYVAGVACGFFYLVVGAFGATLVGAFAALPGALVAVVSGLALLGAFMSGLSQAMEDGTRRESALVTFLVTVSGVSLAGVGAPFWGLCAGLLVNAVLCRAPAAAAGLAGGAGGR